ncbi:MAG: hypothetical protein LBD48_04355 [Treponema sp.]|jgi:DnaJ-class molecular chaperone|nr:hypothetical protein [Treponema sp.]
MKRKKIVLVLTSAALLALIAMPVMARRVGCDNCGSTGVVTCYSCGGRGEVKATHQTRPGSKKGPIYEDCRICPDSKNIRGKLACNVCSGTGYQEVADDQNYNFNFSMDY